MPVPDFVDPYIDPATGLLRNKVGATTQADLDAREAELTAIAAVELAARPVKITADLRQLTAIHKHLFQDVYDWAGELRTVDIRKGGVPGAEFFMAKSRLESAAGFVFQELAEDNMLAGPGKTTRTKPRSTGRIEELAAR
jgi:cell filamentation protein